MTTNVVERMSGELVEARGMVRQIAEQLGQMTDPKQIRDVADRVKVAREWAKVRKLAGQMRVDLLRLEIQCLRRIVEIDGMKELDKGYWAAARFFASMTNEKIEALIVEHSRSMTPISLHRAETREEERRGGYASGQDFARNPDQSDGAIYAEGYRRYQHFSDSAMAVVLDHAAAWSSATRGEGFTIAEIADDFIGLYGDERFDGLQNVAFRRGVVDACRAAVRRAPSRRVLMGSCEVPRFVTAQRGKNFYRVPFENAALGDLDNMIAGRLRQIEQDEAALARLIDVRDVLARAMTDGEENLGVLAERAGWEIPNDLGQGPYNTEPEAHNHPGTTR